MKSDIKKTGAALVQDQGVALRIRCVAYPESSPHYADAVNVAATSLTLSIDGAADATVGATGVLAYATYTTLGALVDAINASANWKAELVGALRSDSTGSSTLLARTTSTFKMFKDVNIYFDSSVIVHLDYLLEAPAFSSRELRAITRVGLSRIIAKNNNSGDALAVKVYEVDHAKSSSTLLAQFDVADDTEKDSGATDELLLQSSYGKELLVRFIGATTLSDTNCYLRVFGERETKGK